MFTTNPYYLVVFVFRHYHHCFNPPPTFNAFYIIFIIFILLISTKDCIISSFIFIPQERKQCRIQCLVFRKICKFQDYHHAFLSEQPCLKELYPIFQYKESSKHLSSLLLLQNRIHLQTYFKSLLWVLHLRVPFSLVFFWKHEFHWQSLSITFRQLLWIHVADLLGFSSCHQLILWIIF